MISSLRLLMLCCLFLPIAVAALGASEWVSWVGGFAGCFTLFGVRLALTQHKGSDAGR